MVKVITFGTFDLFHIGHLQILKRARALRGYLIAGVSTDALNFSKKQRNPICNQQHRVEIIQELKCVDEIFFEDSLELKRKYIIDTKADILVMGDDWKGRFDEFKDICEVVYLPRMPSISTTALIEIVREVT